MKSKYVSRNSSDRLILIFAGWGMDWHLFSDLSRPGYDILIIWDYKDLSFNWKPLSKYNEICLIAWSMGVFAASITIHEIEQRITTRIAINGTLVPIDEAYGISPAIWHGTLNALSPGTWRKFQRRMCSSAAQFEDYTTRASQRTIADIKEELIALETHTLFHADEIKRWDMAIVSLHDGIFPYTNQIRAWSSLAPVRIVDSGHLPDFRQIIARLVIDKERVGKRFTRAAGTYHRSASVQHLVAETLMKHFDTIFESENIVGNVIEIGPGADCCLTRLWIDRTDTRAKISLWDLVDLDVSTLRRPVKFEKCDAELRIRKEPSASAGFIFSSSTVQWFNSLREFIRECERVLYPGGYLVLSTYLAGNLPEMSEISGNGLQLHSLDDWNKLIPDGMEILVKESEFLRLSFDSPRQVAEHFRETGVNGVSYGQSSLSVLRKILDCYPEDPETGKYNLTYLPVYIIARKLENRAD